MPRQTPPPLPASVRPEGRLSPGFFRQTWILLRRYTAIWLGDRSALLTLLGQSLLVAVLLGVVFGNLGDVENKFERAQRTINLLFLLTVSCFWFGCNNSAKEVVKESILYRRERNFNLRIDSYFASKLLVLAVIVLVQVSLFFAIIHTWCAPPDSGFLHWLTLAAVALAGTCLGLLISTNARTEEVAIALVPIAVIPQIILAGIIAPLKGLGKTLAKTFITTYWGQQAIEALVPKDLLDLVRSEPDSFADLWIVGLHAVVFAALTVVALWLKDWRRDRT